MLNDVWLGLPSIDHLKGVSAKNERGYRLNAIKKARLIATNLTSICYNILQLICFEFDYNSFATCATI